MGELTTQVPTLDKLTIKYLGESISTYNSEHLLSSAITLGVASENIILQLIDSFLSATSKQNEKMRLTKEFSKGGIYRKFELLKEELKKYSKSLPSEITQDLDAKLDGIFNIIRITRNNAGHPTEQSPSKNMVGSNLQIFAEYSKQIVELIEYLKKNKLSPAVTP